MRRAVVPCGMHRRPWSRLAPRVGVVLALASVLALTARAETARQPGRATVAVRALAAGRILVSARGLPDRHFAETVILLVDHGPTGAMGLALNRPTGLKLTRVLPGLDTDAGASRFTASSTAFAGGPVSPDMALALSRVACTGCTRVAKDVYLLRSAAALQEQVDTGADARRLRVFVGYSGWGPDQLETETRAGAWHVLDADARDVFDPDPETLWERLIKRTESVVARGGSSPQPDTAAP